MSHENEIGVEVHVDELAEVTVVAVRIVPFVYPPVHQCPAHASVTASTPGGLFDPLRRYHLLITVAPLFEKQSRQFGHVDEPTVDSSQHLFESGILAVPSASAT